jgi:hypothetical protein
MSRAERVLMVVVTWLTLSLCGCAIAARSDKFGADVEFGVGGLLGYIANVHFKGSIGFSRTCNHDKESQDEEGAGAPVDPFLHWL